MYYFLSCFQDNRLKPFSCLKESNGNIRQNDGTHPSVFRTLAPDDTCEFLKGIPKKYVMLMSGREELSNVMDIEYTYKCWIGFYAQNFKITTDNGEPGICLA